MVKWYYWEIEDGQVQITGSGDSEFIRKFDEHIEKYKTGKISKIIKGKKETITILSKEMDIETKFATKDIFSSLE